MYSFVLKITTKIRGYEFEGEWGGAYQRAWREEQKGKNSYYNCKSKVSKPKIVVQVI